MIYCVSEKRIRSFFYAQKMRERYKIKRIVIQVEVARYAHKNHIGMYGM